LPFILDAIFKEDIDAHTEPLILSFINNHLPSDTQSIFTVAFTEEQISKLDSYKKHFGDEFKTITIGEMKRDRSLLNPSTGINDLLITSTESIIDEL